jgi:4a-hydroxytetrahydrobiopterin dehydratase
MKFSEKKCIPCEDKGIEPLSCEQVQQSFALQGTELVGWKSNDTCTRITTERIFPDFVTAIEFINQVAALAESEGHHPDISIWYNRIQLDLWTHSIGGLSENDFIVAAKINQINTVV